MLQKRLFKIVFFSICSQISRSLNTANKRYLVEFRNTNPLFRLNELRELISQISGSKYADPNYLQIQEVIPDIYSNQPVCIYANFPSEEVAIQVAKRSCVIRTIIEVFGQGKTSFDACKMSIQNIDHIITETRFQPYKDPIQNSWRMIFRRFGRQGKSGLDHDGKRQKVEEFGDILRKINGVVDLKNPVYDLIYLEDWSDYHNNTVLKEQQQHQAHSSSRTTTSLLIDNQQDVSLSSADNNSDSNDINSSNDNRESSVYINEPSLLSSSSSSSSSSPSYEQATQCYFGLIIAESPSITGIYDLKTRPFIGTTSMDEISSHMAAVAARIVENDIVLDPYCGTGSLLIASAHLGAYVIGSDYDCYNFQLKVPNTYENSSNSSSNSESENITINTATTVATTTTISTTTANNDNMTKEVESIVNIHNDITTDSEIDNDNNNNSEISLSMENDMGTSIFDINSITTKSDSILLLDRTRIIEKRRIKKQQQRLEKKQIKLGNKQFKRKDMSQSSNSIYDNFIYYNLTERCLLLLNMDSMSWLSYYIKNTPKKYSENNVILDVNNNKVDADSYYFTIHNKDTFLFNNEQMKAHDIIRLVVYPQSNNMHILNNIIDLSYSTTVSSHDKNSGDSSSSTCTVESAEDPHLRSIYTMHRNDFHIKRKLDAIVSDPPFGIREKAYGHALLNTDHHMGDPKRAVATLFLIAKYYLKSTGRLVFWLPTASYITTEELQCILNEIIEYTEDNMISKELQYCYAIPQFLHSKLTRWLCVYEKT